MTSSLIPQRGDGERKAFIRVAGVPISVTNIPDSVATILGWVSRGDSKYVCVSDVNCFLHAQDNEEFRQVFENAGLVVPDGMPLVWVMRWRKASGVARVCGADLTEALCAASANSGVRHFFYGGKPSVAATMAMKLKSRYPALEVVGVLSPPFHRLSVSEDAAITQQLAEAKPQIVWVGLGAPKQEIWMRDHVGRIPGAVLLGVGAAFDFHAGIIKRAPKWIQNSGFEWLFRIAQEPGRLWRRYALIVPRFALALLRDPNDK
jgi:N-acetylglucosaminyldiphosphoundecaprenol N-acetyl-beta-D-mannosaminyltransferase